MPDSGKFLKAIYTPFYRLQEGRNSGYHGPITVVSSKLYRCKVVRYGELENIVSAYIRSDLQVTIPVEYYREAIKMAIQKQNDGKHWDMRQSAAVLLYYAFNDGYLHPSQLTTDGLDALTHSEKLLYKPDVDNLQEEIIDCTRSVVLAINNK